MNNLTILDSEASIKAAIATMHPIAKDAAQIMANNLLESPGKQMDADAIQKEWMQCCVFAAARGGINPNANKDKFDAFMENHGHSVLNVSMSIVAYSNKQKKWGWLKKAAVVGGAFLLGSFFG
jgi:hypothetical protein